jgi:glutamyl-tRNA synthetase
MVNDAKAGCVAVDIKKEMGDFAIRRRDGIAAYQVASLCDDMDHRNNLIIRGADLLASTAAQLYLASLIDSNDFDQTTFYHHRLFEDASGHKLSKSNGSYSLKAMRESDTSANALYALVCKALGWKQRCTSLMEMLDCVKAGTERIL